MPRVTLPATGVGAYTPAKTRCAQLLWESPQAICATLPCRIASVGPLGKTPPNNESPQRMPILCCWLEKLRPLKMAIHRMITPLHKACRPLLARARSTRTPRERL